jgi:hypothetical protein
MKSGKSKFVTWFAIFAGLASVVGLLSGAIQLLAFQGLEQQPEVADLALAAVRQQTGSVLSLDELKRTLLEYGLFSVASSLVGLVLTYGLLRRRPWSRTGAIYLIFFMTLGMVSGSIASVLPVSHWLYWLSLAFSMLIVGVHAGIIVRLRSPEVQAEFVQRS